MVSACCAARHVWHPAFRGLSAGTGYRQKYPVRPLGPPGGQRRAEKVDVGEHGSRFEYRLTEKGRDLFPVVIALRQWGNKWNPAPDDASLDLRDRTTGQPIQTVQVQNAEGEPITVRDVFVSAAPVSGTKKTLPDKPQVLGLPPGSPVSLFSTLCEIPKFCANGVTQA